MANLSIKVKKSPYLEMKRAAMHSHRQILSKLLKIGLTGTATVSAPADFLR